MDIFEIDGSDMEVVRERRSRRAWRWATIAIGAAFAGIYGTHFAYWLLS